MTTKPKYTPEEIEEAKYEAWVLSGGPAKVTEREKKRAWEYVAQKLVGWKTISFDMRVDFDGVNVLEAIVRRNDQVRLIRWKPFNGGFMTPLANGMGWIIFNPEEK
jgi:hypothetical protein